MMIGVDRLCAGSLLWLIRNRRGIQSACCFEPPGRFANLLFNGLQRLGLLRFVPIPVSGHIGRLREADGESAFAVCLKQGQRLAEAWRSQHIADHPLLAAMPGDWDRVRAAWYLQRCMEQQAARELMRLRLTAWMAAQQPAPSAAVMLIRQAAWLPLLDAAAAEGHVRLATYRNTVADAASVVARACRRLIARRQSRKTDSAPTAQATVPPEQGGAWRVAVRYWYRMFSDDAADRSELFWMPHAPFAAASLLVHSPDGAINGSDAAVRQLADGGVRFINAPVRFGKQAAGRCARMLLRLWLAAAACLVLRRRRLCDVAALSRLVVQEASWHAWLRREGVAVHIAPCNPDALDVAIPMALEALGGVSMAYQYSASNWMAPTGFLSTGEHVQFVFSQPFAEIWRGLSCPVERIVPVGYVTDSAFAPLRRRGRSAVWRAKLLDGGARRIICYFDENSLPSWDSYASHADAAAEYAALFRWVLEDSSIGLICKIKRSRDLRQRLGAVNALADAALASGRCLWVSGDATLVDATFPAEAAMASDLAVGKLSGSTAAIEARLAGIPALLVDTDGLIHHPLRRWLPGVVLDRFEALPAAVAQHYQAGSATAALAGWEQALPLLDSFRDGRAAARMAGYIGAVAAALAAGSPRREALQKADAWLAQQAVAPSALSDRPSEAVAAAAGGVWP